MKGVDIAKQLEQIGLGTNYKGANYRRQSK